MNRRPEKTKAPASTNRKGFQGEESQTATKGTIMSNSTAAPVARAITVPFHGADLYVIEHNGQPYTPMKPVVSGMGLDWAAQFSKLKANPSRWGIAEIAIPTISGMQSMICLPLRKLFGWLSGINIGKIRESLRERVTIFQNECDDVLWQYWNDGMAINPRAAFAVNPGDLLTKDEAEALRLMLKSAADRLPKSKQGALMMQGWSKLKAHFKVGYREIPRHEFSEAVSIIARHTAEWEVVDDEPLSGSSMDDAVRLQHAFTLAAQTAAKVQQAVFSGVMSGNEDWKHSRYLVNLGIVGRDGDVAVQARRIESNACVLPISRFHSVIEDSITVDAQTLAQIASTCMARLGRMAQRVMQEQLKLPTAA